MLEVKGKSEGEKEEGCQKRTVKKRSRSGNIVKRR